MSNLLNTSRIAQITIKVRWTNELQNTSTMAERKFLFGGERNMANELKYYEICVGFGNEKGKPGNSFCNMRDSAQQKLFFGRRNMSNTP